MNDSQLRNLLLEAMQEYAPKPLAQMKARGQLNPYLDELMGQTLQAINDPTQEATMALVTQGSPQFEPNPLKRVQEINMATNSATEIALAQAMETIKALNPESAMTIASDPES